MQSPVTPKEIGLFAPERFGEFPLDLPLRQTHIPQVTLVEVGKGLPVLDPAAPNPEEAANPREQT